MTLNFLVRFALAALLAMVIAALIANRPAAAASLRDDVTVAADVVTLGDLFEGAGALADRPVFRSPDPGVEGALPARDAIAAARAAGLDPDPTPYETIRVVRRSVSVNADALASLVADAVAAAAGVNAADVTVDFDLAPAAFAAVAQPVLESFGRQESTGRFRARVLVDLGDREEALDLAGAARPTVAVAVPARPIARGETIGESDLVYERRPARGLPAGALTRPEEIAGLAARRPIRAGEVLAAGLLEEPRIVRRGNLVTLVYESPGLALTARGKALADAAEGETVAILNEQSRRTVEGIAIGPDRVRIEPRRLRTAAVGAAHTVE